MNNSRRSFITKSLLGAGIVAQFDQQTLLTNLAKTNNKNGVNSNDVILFQGDSITDTGRDRSNKNANDTSALGSGYAHLVAAKLLEQFASQNIQIYNRGISGNKVPELQNRWKEDCIDLKPNILSILIGVNDYWHKRDGHYKGSALDFKNQLRNLIQSTVSQFPQIKLVLGEPFAVKNVQVVNDSWFPEFADYQQAVRDIAKEFRAILIPYQQIFDEAEKKAPGSYWTSDGIHTSLAGAQLMAKAWLEAVQLK